MPRWLLILLVVAALSVVGGTAAVVYLAERDRIRAAFRAAALRYGLPPDWLDALAYTESRWSSATNMSGTDGSRGGAWGPSQITERTARAFGFDGFMFELNENPELAADLTARMVADGFAERGGRTFHFGPPPTFEAMCTVWNAGRTPGAQDMPARVAAEYLPRAAEALALVQTSGEPGGWQDAGSGVA